MKIAVAEVLGSHLRPLCSRDNRVMKYESRQILETRLHTTVVSKDAAFDMTPPRDITCSLECVIPPIQKAIGSGLNEYSRRQMATSKDRIRFGTTHSVIPRI